MHELMCIYFRSAPDMQLNNSMHFSDNGSLGRSSLQTFCLQKLHNYGEFSIGKLQAHEQHESISNCETIHKNTHSQFTDLQNHFTYEPVHCENKNK